MKKKRRPHIERDLFTGLTIPERIIKRLDEKIANNRKPVKIESISIKEFINNFKNKEMKTFFTERFKGKKIYWKNFREVGEIEKQLEIWK